MPAPHLPNEILVKIAAHLTGSPQSRKDLPAFAHVNRQWHQVGLEILYANVVLTDNTMGLFTSSFKVQEYGRLVQSLTLRINHEDLCGKHCAQTPTWFEKLVAIVRKLEKLSTFSLVFTNNSTPLPQVIITELLPALPASCTNLELDSNHDAHFLVGGKPHVCDVLRDLLPRMEHVRLRLRMLCGSIFGTGDPCTNDFLPISLPNIKSLVINCGGGGSYAGFCGQSCKTVVTHAYHAQLRCNPFRSDATDCVKAGLEKVLEQRGETLKEANIFFANTWTDSYMDAPPDRCAFFVKISKNGKWKVQKCRLWLPWDWEKLLERLSNQRNAPVTFGPPTLVEPLYWADVEGGTRLPAEALRVDVTGSAAASLDMDEILRTVIENAPSAHLDNIKQGHLKEALSWEQPLIPTDNWSLNLDGILKHS
ncbi:hypothetical protein M011DRAFT_481443 [Sporormia fimetaria CBS 119925]|uniref:Uncharacterized protein n=1 Tax=Sporormia fimetaria CBS 119925 TaxID=1340428 RepID=A0A6A6UYY0_9PLEO|nr:hypothetical protein M011DRAFT_481443 [Sporormia fimetaria CBS 119925]